MAIAQTAFLSAISSLTPTNGLREYAATRPVNPFGMITSACLEEPPPGFNSTEWDVFVSGLANDGGAAHHYFHSKAPLVDSLELTDAEAAHVGVALRNFAPASFLANRAEIKERLLRNLPENIAERLCGFAELAASPVLLVKAPGQTQNIAAILFGMGEVLGSCYIETNETDQIVQDVFPKESEADLQTSGSSTTPLHLHVENVGMPRVPDYVGIGCIRNHEGAATRLVDPVKVIQQMLVEERWDSIDRLREPRFWARAPRSFGQEQKKIHGLSILQGNTYNPRIVADFADMDGETMQHISALTDFRDYCERQVQEVVMTPGDILIMKNTGFPLCMHGRGKFTPNPTPGEARHLKRIFVASAEHAVW